MMDSQGLTANISGHIEGKGLDKVFFSSEATGLVADGFHLNLRISFTLGEVLI